MKDPIKDFENYRSFLGSIPLDKYRVDLRYVKWVEQDLPREMLPLKSIFKYYWEQREYFSFDDWFEEFWEEINNDPSSREVVKDFKEYYFDNANNEWFKLGFKARMYRTWVSVLTQLDFCYLFEYICAKNEIYNSLKLKCSAELDIKGIDAMVYNIGFQIAKISQRKEARIVSKKERVVTVPYAVYNIEEFKRKCESPRVRDKMGYKKALNAFYKYFSVLENGFVVFNENYIKPLIDNIDNIEKVREIVENISLELSGYYE